MVNFVGLLTTYFDDMHFPGVYVVVVSQSMLFMDYGCLAQG